MLRFRLICCIPHLLVNNKLLIPWHQYKTAVPTAEKRTIFSHKHKHKQSWQHRCGSSMLHSSSDFLWWILNAAIRTLNPLKTTDELTNTVNVHVAKLLSHVRRSWQVWAHPVCVSVSLDAEPRPLWTLCPSFSQSGTAGIVPLFPHESSSDRPLSANKAFGYAKWWQKPRGDKIRREGGFGSQSCKSFLHALLRLTLETVAGWANWLGRLSAQSYEKKESGAIWLLRLHV